MSNKSGTVILSNFPPLFTFPLGLFYVAGYLIENKENVEIEFWPGNQKYYSDFVDNLIRKKPLAVGFGGLYPDLYTVRELIDLLNKAGRNFPIIIGGQMVTPTPEFAVAITGADFGVVGEGEIIFHNLINALRNGQRDFTNIKGIIIREGDKTISTGAGPYIEDLSNLPRIPFELMKDHSWLYSSRFYVSYNQIQWKYNDRVIPIHTGRGCPFKCNFCYHHSKPRYKPIEKIRDDIIDAIERFNPTLLDFSDDLVLANVKRVTDFIKMMNSINKCIEYYLSIRFDTLSKMSDELLKELKDSGCRVVGPGLESGSQKILDSIHKKITVDQIKTGIRRLKDAGIMTTTCIQVGQINETLDDAQQSMQLIKESLQYDKHIAFAFAITTPFPGSELYRIALDKGIIKSDLDFFNIFNPKKALSSITLNLSSMTNAEILDIKQKMADTYMEMKFNSMTKFTRYICNSRNHLVSIRTKINLAIFDKIPDNPVKKLFIMPFEFCYHKIQTFLDMTCRKLWQ